MAGFCMADHRLRATSVRDHVSAEIVAVDALDLVPNLYRHRNAVINHQLGKLATVDQDHARDDVGGVFDSPRREARSRDKDAFGRALPMQSSHETLNLRATDR